MLLSQNISYNQLVNKPNLLTNISCKFNPWIYKFTETYLKKKTEYFGILLNDDRTYEKETLEMREL